jgi:hypothetical protein
MCFCCRKGPIEKYSGPVTEAQEIGWFHDELVTHPAMLSCQSQRSSGTCPGGPPLFRRLPVLALFTRTLSDERQEAQPLQLRDHQVLSSNSTGLLLKLLS